MIFITVDIFKHTAKKNKKIKRADQILPEVYGTTLKAVNRGKTDNRMTKWKQTLCKTLHRKLKIKQHEHHQTPGDELRYDWILIDKMLVS